jgi:phosphoglycerate dehydrogenase-like enzyme
MIVGSTELRGKTMGIVGYGDIGRSCAKLATVYGMRVVALRRRPYLSKRDPLCDVVYGTDKASLNELMSVSDYIVCSAPSTFETRGMVDAAAFSHVKQNAVFMNLGRGPVIDENALIKALQNGRLKGAALDVFQEEPLPLDNPLWTLDNVMISPHNMDQTSTFMHEATEFFVNENLPRFICGEELLNPVDVEAGY